MNKKFFIAGTDTDVGKTLVACGLLHALNQKGLSTLALKPIAAGCEMTDKGLRNDDALALIEAMSLECPYDQVNPVKMAAAIAPHIALEEEGRRVTAAQLEGYCRGALMKKGDVCLIEGAGGWRVPLNEREFISALPIQLQTPVILVVGIRLGCISHALLTVEAIRNDGLLMAGWVANRIDSQMSRGVENVEYLKAMIPAPFLGEVPHLENATGLEAMQYLSVDALLGAGSL
ncbi:MAG: dethiobiotin synthase [Pseudomonadales bacterium]|nr:dethiobiotin synthase [Pseudomonadales bacterium]